MYQKSKSKAKEINLLRKKSRIYQIIQKIKKANSQIHQNKIAFAKLYLMKFIN